MFTLLDFNQYAINEALNLTLAKYYTKLWKDAKGDKRYNKMFKGKNRIYLPLEVEQENQIELPYDLETEIRDALRVLGYEPVDFQMDRAKQIKGNRENKITRILKKDKERRYNELLNQYMDWLSEWRKAEDGKYQLVISRHGYDIASMSTDRGWTNCMNVIDGDNKEYIEADIEKGSIIAYLIKMKDTNIKDARARLLIKPFVSSDGKEIVLFSDKRVYGEDLSGFRETVDKWLEENQTISKFKYKLLNDLYDDGLNQVCNLKGIEIQQILDEIVDGKYEIENDIINVKGDVKFHKLYTKRKSIKETLLNKYSFGMISDNFYCNDNGLTSLEGAPREVGGDFRCTGNLLTNLEGAPREVGGDFSCYSNQLTSLKGASQEVGGSFNCNFNRLTSLEGAPQKVGVDFDCTYNQLISLKGAPPKVDGSFDCSNNRLTSLEGAPLKINGYFGCFENQLTSLKGAPQKVGGKFNCSLNRLTSLEGAPPKVDFLNCARNSINTLKGFPIKVKELLIHINFPFTDEEIKKVCNVKKINRI